MTANWTIGYVIAVKEGIMNIDPGQNHILVVDDDDFIRDMLATRLALRGYQVTAAQNGWEALQYYQQTEFDLILLDIMMPGLTGIEVLQRLKAEENETPVVVMSALSEVRHVVECIQLGAEDYFHKPIESELLWARITASLEKKHYRDSQKTWLEDLNLLQQIDQELNTTLNRDEVSRLTLHWVTKKSEALAGMIGSVEGNQVKVRATHGFSDPKIQSFTLAELAIHTVGEAIEQTTLGNNGRLHPDATDRITIPIIRNSIIRDIIILDTAAPAPATTIRFLKRLSTHIAIALHNAQLYAEVQEANKAKSNFVAMVSHELKNPLTAIQAYIYLLRRQKTQLTEEQSDAYLEIIHDGSKRIHHLALELDDVTQMETGQFKLNIEQVSLPDILNDLGKLFDPQLAAKSQTLTVNIPEKLPLVRADAKRLSQILVNLISNASKYTLEAGMISVSAREISEDGMSSVHIAIQDSGIGIAPEEHEKVFSQFFRADDVNVTKERGTGLGLHITKKLVELQGGEIGFTSVYNQGSTFFFTLPAMMQETAALELPQPVS